MHSSQLPMRGRIIPARGQSMEGMFPADPITLPGMNFKRQRPARESDYYIGVEASSGGVDEDATFELFQHLAARMNGSPTAGPDAGFENPNIPAGYTYLAQLTAHDLTINSQTEVSLLNQAESENLQARPLVLDTLYGNGPAISAFCYQHASGLAPTDACLRLDAVGQNPAQDADAPRRDIGRLCESNGTRKLGIPLIADARNDDNSILSQLVALFSMVHNTCVALSKESAPRNRSTFYHYGRARYATTTVYRSVIRNDLLKRLLDQKVYDYYARSNDAGRFLTDVKHSAVVSREFAHAAFRIGHAMVRPTYRLNRRDASRTILQVLQRTSVDEPHATPLDRSWIIEWSRFFDFPELRGDDRLQKSMRIGPGYASALNSQFRIASEEDRSGLAFKDLHRSAVSHVQKLAIIVEGIENSAPPDFPHRDWLAYGEGHAAMLREWVEGEMSVHGFGGLFPEPIPADLANSFIANPPLLLFILIEAFRPESNFGERLGPLGSVILAETFFRVLDDPRFVDTFAQNGLPDPAAEIFNNRTPSTMPDLIAWLDHHSSQSDKVFKDGEALPII